MTKTALDILNAAARPGMTFEAFLEKIVDTGIAGARESYGEGNDKFRGSEAGFEECRGKNPSELATLLSSAMEDQQQAFRDDVKDYWYWNCRMNEVHWVCNCVSVVLNSSNSPVIVQPTARAVMHVSRILSGEV